MDSGYDELRAESPSLVGECVELFSPLDSTPAEAVMYTDEFDYNEQCAVQPFAAQAQWSDDAVASPPAYAPQHFAAPVVDHSGFPADFVDEQAMQHYEDLVTSPFVNELCGELDRWNEEIEAVGGDPMAASQTMPSAALDFLTEDVGGLEDLDLFGFCNV